MEDKHPLAVSEQEYIVPSDVQVGDQIGEVGFLYTFTKIWNKLEGTNYTESQFRFLKFLGSENFQVNSLTGMISVASTAGLTGSTSITVRVSIGSLYQDVLCSISYANDCIYFDSAYDDSANPSDGTRAKPYKKFNGSGLTATPGKSYFYRRGREFSREWIVVTSPKIAGEYPDWITFDAWGQGTKPLINGNDQREGPTTVRRFMDIGGGSFSNIDEAFEANKVRVANFSFTHDKTSTFYPFLVKFLGEYKEFRRIDFEETIFSEGFMYFPVELSFPHSDKKVYLCDITTKNNVERSIKLETGGVIGRNFRNRNYGTTLTEHPAPSAANYPDVDLQFIDAYGENINPSNLGLQARSSNQRYKWAWLKGFAFPTTIFIHSSLDPLGGIYRVYDCSFTNIFMEGTTQGASYFGRHSGTSGVAMGVLFDRCVVIGGKGFQADEGATDTIFRYCTVKDTSADGFRIFSGAGDGTKIINCLAVNNFSNDIELSRAGVEVINSVYVKMAGTPILTTSSTSELEADLIGVGTDQGIDFDSLGNPVANPPSIGPTEYSVAATEYSISTVATNGTATGGGTYPEGSTAELTATSFPGFVFVRWTEGLFEITQNPYSFTVTGSRVLTAVFAAVVNPTVDFRGYNFGSMESKYGQYLNDQYNRVKASGGEFGASLMDVKPTTDKLLQYDWDMANILFSNIGSVVPSLIGADLNVSGGGGGSRFTKNGLLVTGLPNNEPRFNFENGIFKGVLLEVDDTNRVLYSEAGPTEAEGSTYHANMRAYWNNIVYQQSELNRYENVLKVFKTATTGSVPIVKINGLGEANFIRVRVLTKRLSGSTDGISFLVRNHSKGVNFSSVSLYYDNNTIAYNGGGTGEWSLNILANGWLELTFVSNNRIIDITDEMFVYLGATGGQIPNTGTEFLFSRIMATQKTFGTSFIKTLTSPVSRPADIYTASGLINTVTDYSILERINEESILKYVEPGPGTMKTYINGVYIGVEAFTPVPDLIITSTGSDMLSAVAYKSGALTETELIERSLI